MPHRSVRILSALAATAALGACGGGGGQEPAAPATPARASTALSAQPRPAPDFQFPGFVAAPALGTADLGGAAALFADPSRAWVSFWQDEADGSRRQLAFLPLSVLRALDARGGLPLTLAVGSGPVRFEIHDRSQQVQGEVAR